MQMRRARFIRKINRSKTNLKLFSKNLMLLIIRIITLCNNQQWKLRLLATTNLWWTSLRKIPKQLPQHGDKLINTNNNNNINREQHLIIRMKIILMNLVMKMMMIILIETRQFQVKDKSSKYSIIASNSKSLITLVTMMTLIAT